MRRIIWGYSMKLVINSDSRLSEAIGGLRTAYAKDRYLTVNIKAGKPRSLDQNALSFAWYEQVAEELREQTINQVRRENKLVVGVPILRAEEEDFRKVYDSSLKMLPYEQKLELMDFIPVTSLMNTNQLSQYLEGMKERYKGRVELRFPDEA